MKKLKLNISDLKVESFNVNNSKTKAKGTVYGNFTTPGIDSTCNESCPRIACEETFDCPLPETSSTCDACYSGTNCNTGNFCTFTC